MDDEHLLRYSRQILLPQIDIAGQQNLGNARCLVIGLGGLGSPVAMYLAAAGVGHLILNDDDQVDLSNLQRQIMHGGADVGTAKTASASRRLAELNPQVRISTLSQRMDYDELVAQAGVADVILDCSDNFKTRFMVNRASLETRTPLVSGATIRFEGQVSVFDPGNENSPCYHCLYEESAETDESCSRNGVIAPMPGIVGSIQALEAIKLITGAGTPLVGRLLLIDALSMEWNSLNLRKNPHCPACSCRPERSPAQS